LLDTIEAALADIRQGKVVIVVDDEDRENEGDMICASECVTPELVNFMVREGRGLLCVSLTAARCQELDLPLMVQNNTALHQTAFTVSIDLLGPDSGTGISASDRSKTIQALVNPRTQPQQLGRPGHIFPLIAQNGGVLARPGHTEAAVDLAVLAGFQPSGVLIEVLSPDGSMARLPELRELANRLDLKVISIEALVAYISAKQTSSDTTVSSAEALPSVS
jgi:3,4-dihydroxy 2-butanone 4-phosphate synthase/GTP cyclohydrolase II